MRNISQVSEQGKIKKLIMLVNFPLKCLKLLGEVQVVTFSLIDSLCVFDLNHS